jgi:hypothetical protein
MRSYILYKDKSVKGFKRLINSGNSIFDKYRSLATSFIRYAGSDLDTQLSVYAKEIDINSIALESVFPTKYKWLVSNVALKNSRTYLESLESRITEFEGGKEDNLKILVGILFIRFVLVTKLVETYLGAAVALKKSGKDVSKLTLSDIGIGKSSLKYFDNFQELGSKTIDDWINYQVDPVTARYFYSSMKRILSVLVGDDSSF